MEAHSPSSFARILTQGFPSGPRLGFSNSFADLFSQNEEVVNNYLTGLLVAGIVVLGVFVIWGFLLLAFACCGRKRLGFLSGAPFQATKNKADAGTVSNPWIATGRAVFASSCVLFSIFSIVLVTAGIGNMNATSTTIGRGAIMGIDFFTDSRNTLREIRGGLDLLIEMKNNLLEELKEFHDNLDPEQLTRPQDEATAELEVTVLVVIESLDGLEDFLRLLLRDIDASLSDGQQTFEGLYEVTETIDLRVLQAVVGLVMTIFSTCLLVCFCWNTYGTKRNARLDTFRAWFLWPVFLLLVGLSILTVGAMSIAGMVNADFCIGGQYKSPDATILEILDNQGVDPNSLDYRAILCLVSNCDINAFLIGTPLKDVEGLEREVQATIGNLTTTLDQVISIGVDVLTEQTGSSVTLLTDHIEELQPDLHELLGLLRVFINSLACRPLHSVYTTIVHQATCSDSYTGTFWIFLSLFFTSFFGLMAITFRSAMYPVVDIADDWEQELQQKSAEGTKYEETEQSTPHSVDQNATLISAATSTSIGNTQELDSNGEEVEPSGYIESECMPNTVSLIAAGNTLEIDGNGSVLVVLQEQSDQESQGQEAILADQAEHHQQTNQVQPHDKAQHWDLL